jgi:hypothetical protein
MSHYCVLVTMDPKSPKSIEEVMAPYDENTTMDPYVTGDVTPLEFTSFISWVIRETLFPKAGETVLLTPTGVDDVTHHDGLKNFNNILLELGRRNWTLSKKQLEFTGWVKNPDGETQDRLILESPNYGKDEKPFNEQQLEDWEAMRDAIAKIIKDYAMITPVYEMFGERWNSHDWKWNNKKALFEDWSTYNPKSKWDWYAIGGRWRGFFPTPEDAEIHAIGEPGLQSSNKDYDGEEEGRGRSDILMKKDISREVMRADATRQSTEAYEAWEKEVADEMIKEDSKSKDLIRKQLSWRYGIRHLEKEDRYQTLEESIEENVGKALSFGLLHDGTWHENGKMGWFGSHSPGDHGEKTWDEVFWEIWETIPDDYMVMAIDCHI